MSTKVKWLSGLILVFLSWGLVMPVKAGKVTVSKISVSQTKKQLTVKESLGVKRPFAGRAIVLAVDEERRSLRLSGQLPAWLKKIYNQKDFSVVYDNQTVFVLRSKPVSAAMLQPGDRLNLTGDYSILPPLNPAALAQKQLLAKRVVVTAVKKR